MFSYSLSNLISKFHNLLMFYCFSIIIIDSLVDTSQYPILLVYLAFHTIASYSTTTQSFYTKMRGGMSAHKSSRQEVLDIARPR